MDASKLASFQDRGILRLSDGARYTVDRSLQHGEWTVVFGSLRSDSIASEPRIIIVNDDAMREWYIQTYRQPRNTRIVTANDVETFDAPTFRVNHNTALRDYASMRDQAEKLASSGK